jgi:hypothetical protein
MVTRAWRADPEDIRPVEPDPLLEGATVEIAEEDTGPRADDRESGAEHLATLATQGEAVEAPQ